MGDLISSNSKLRANETKSLDNVISNGDIVVGGVRSSSPRITPLAMDALPDEVRSCIDRLPADSFKNKYSPVNVIGTVARSSEVSASLIDHYVQCRELISLSHREQELIILRMAVHYRSEYVWKHHVVIGSEFGITKTECEALQKLSCCNSTTTASTTLGTLSDRETALIAMIDDLVITRTISNSTWESCNAFFAESEIIDIILLVSHYTFFSLVNNSLCVDVEPVFNDIPGLTQSLEGDYSENHAAVVVGVCSSIPRMTPLAMDALPEQVLLSLDRLPADSFKNKYAPVNVVGTIAKSSEAAASFLDHWVSSKKMMSPTNREQELVILRMAVHYRSEYVWKHHVLIGSEFGITKTECEALQKVPYYRSTITPDTLSGRENALIALTDDLVTARTVTNSTWESCNAFFEDSEIIDIILIVSHYVFFSLVNNAMCVEVEPALNDIPGLGWPSLAEQ